jgi:hypothetical protein
VPDPWRGRGYFIWQHTGHGSLPGYDGFLDLNYCPAWPYPLSAPPAAGALPVIRQGSKIGIHAIAPARARALVEQAAADGAPYPLVKSLNAGLLVEVKAASPETLTIFRRVYHPSANGVEAWDAARMRSEAEQLVDFVAGGLNDAERAAIDWYEPLNEDDPPDYAALARYMMALIDTAEARGIRLALPAFNFGTPEWAEMVAMAETGVFGRMQRGGHVLATHEAVNPFGDDPLTAGSIPGAPAVPGAGPLAWRYRYLYHLLAERGEVVPLVVSEFYAGAGYDPARASEQLARFVVYDSVVRRDAYVLAVCGFTVDPDETWRNQDYTGLYESPAFRDYRRSVAAEPNALDYPGPGKDNLTMSERDAIREHLAAAAAAQIAIDQAEAQREQAEALIAQQRQRLDEALAGITEIVADPPPPPPAPLHTLADRTNQQVFNLFLAAFGRDTYWTRLVAGVGNARVEIMLANRTVPYAGPAVEQMSLTEADKTALIAQL